MYAHISNNWLNLEFYFRFCVPVTSKGVRANMHNRCAHQILYIKGQYTLYAQSQCTGCLRWGKRQKRNFIQEQPV